MFIYGNKTIQEEFNNLIFFNNLPNGGSRRIFMKKSLVATNFEKSNPEKKYLEKHILTRKFRHKKFRKKIILKIKI